MTIRCTSRIILLLAVLGVGFSLWTAPRLPAQVPAHWNMAGQVDGYQPRAMALWMIPVMGLALGLLLLYLPFIDPLRANVDRFRGAYNWLIVGLGVFLLFLHGITLLAGLGVALNVTWLMILAMALLFFGLGFLVERAQPNWFIGIRTPWTLSSPTVWAKTHRLGGLLFKLSAALMLVGLAFPPQVGFYFTLVPLLAAALTTVVYSYFAYRAEKSA
jgi:uncharacterized membrane protein